MGGCGVMETNSEKNEKAASVPGQMMTFFGNITLRVAMLCPTS